MELMKYISWLLVVFFIFCFQEIHFVSGLSIAASQKTIETVYQSVAETATQNATLQCTFQADPNTTITWYKESKLLTDQSKFYIQAKANSSFLTVLGVTVNDIGNYSCNATNNQSSVVDHISLSVKVYTSITSNPTSRTVTGENIYLSQFHCDANGTPAPTFAWVKNGSLLLQASSKFAFWSDGKILQINSVTRYDAGNYTCIASNGKTAESTAAVLSVHYIDKPVLNITSNELTLREKESLHVKCSSASFPSASITWVSDAGVVVSNTDTLSFNSISRINAGSYFCNATNAAGSKKSAGLNFTVQYIDVPTLNISSDSLTLREEESLYVKCSSTSLHASITWVSDAGSVVSNTDTLSFNSINRSNAGRYFCNATNAAGSKMSTGLNITVQYIDVPTWNSSNQLTLKEKESLYVKCSSTSLPSASISWVSAAGVVVSNTDTLSFNSISRNDAGRYFCNATNAVGSKKSAGLTITVQYIDAPNLNISSNQQTLNEKESLYVKCSSTSLPSASITWVSDAGVVVSNTDTLSFNSISRNDAGRYFCNATNSVGSKKSAGFTITVQYIDIPTLNISSNELTLKEKESLYVKCSSTSLPSASITWVSDAGVVVSNTDTLSFNSISRNDAGRYFCNATNAAGSKMSAGLNINVQYIDIPTLNISSNQLTLKEKESFYVKCSSTSLPSASITWVSDAGVVVSNTDTLSFNSINRNDAGRYFCNATNSAGSKMSAGLNINVQYIDVPTFNISSNELTLKEKESLYVKCSSTSLPSASISWVSDAGVVVSNTDTLSFNSISRNDAGRYFCNATNAAGSKISAGLNITVQYIDKPTYNVTSNQITLIEKDSLFVKCSAVSLPAATYIWVTDTGKVISQSDILSFKSISRNETGSYFCNATNSAGLRQSDALRITVHYIDKPTFNVSSPEITLVEKSALYVKCSSTLKPAATFKWISSTGQVVSNTDMLIFNSIDRIDAGRYVCNATNPAGSQTASVNITVQYIDVPKLNASGKISLIEKSSLSLLCTSTALPVAQFKWMSSTGEIVSTIAVLSFASIHRNNSGHYFCNVMNAAGSRTSSQITVDVQYIDAPKLNSSSNSIVLVEKSSLYINCMVDASPSANYKWVSNTGKIVSSNSALAFAFVDRNDTGSYFCNVTNSAGWKSSTIISLTVQYLDVPKLSDSSMAIKEGSSLSVSCSAVASPAADFQWIFNSSIVVSSSHLLAIASVTRFSKGEYSCKATNPAGMTTSEILFLTVQYLDSPIIIPMSPDFVAGNRESVSCSANGYPVPSFAWKTNVKYHTGATARGNTYQWNPISVAHAGNYSCSASNAFGTKITSVLVKVKFSRLENTTISISGTVTQSSATLTLKKFNSIHGPIGYYQVIVKKLDGNFKPVTNTDSLLLLDGFSSTSQNTPYITAEFAASVFDTQNTWNFIIGGGQKTNRTKTTARFRRAVQEYYNAPLDPNSYYTAFYRGYVSSTDFISSPWLTPFKTQPKKDTGLTGGQIAGIVIGVILFLALVVCIIYFINGRRRSDSDEREEKVTQSTRKRPSFLARSLHKTVSDPRTPVAINLFEGHVNSLKANGGFGFSQEYLMISKELLHPHSHSTAPVNSLKNRYANIHSYDHSRVILSRDGSPGSDYINANYIPGFNSSREYIAAQGPLPETINDFWRMVWEQNSNAIVMLTRVMENGRPKCAQYWPSHGSQSCNDLVVSIIEILEFPDHLIRTFHVTKVGQSVERVIKQFHFIGWPDHGVPRDASALFSLLKKVQRWKMDRTALTGPLIVHCSAGVGRTGTYIALDTQIKRVLHNKPINIFENVTELRDQRCWMVQTEDQYAYLHYALVEFIKSGDTEIQAHDLREYIKKKTDVDLKTGSTGLMDEFVSLAKSDAKHGFQEANKAVNQMKNRYKNVYPYDSTRVKLSNIPGMLGSDYINACYIDGYMQSNAFIATQAPLPGTIADFWRMIWEEDSRTIVMLSNEMEAGKVKVNKYWPDEKSVKAWILIVELLNNTDYPEYTLREFKITNSEQGHSRIIRQFQYTAWPENSSPESAFGMIDLIGQVCKWNMSVENRVVTVHCSAGVGRTGLFIALTNLIERLKTEAVVDVYHAVRKLRQQRTAMVQTREQYEFCYRALQEYLDSFDHYANFE